MKIMLLGPPGGGKGTQAKYIEKKWNIPQISTGDMLRNNINNSTSLGIKAKIHMEKGDLVPDNLILAMMEKRLHEVDCKNGYILDGFPRTIPQAESLKQLLSDINQELDLAILLDLDDDIIVERMGGRRVHSSSGRVYHVKYNPPRKENIDDITGENLTIRDDDKEVTVRKRLKVYHSLTAPLISFYKKESVLKIINANRKIEEIKNSIETAINHV